MKISVISAALLSAVQLEAWSRLQQEDPRLDSPFFRPEFTRAVAAVRNDVAVAVFENGGEPSAFFPFQRRGWRIGVPVGGKMSDFQGIIARSELSFSAVELIRACGLRAWDFDHLVASQESFRPHHYDVADSAYMDLSRGYDAFFTERANAGCRTLKELPRKRRKLEREMGEVRFVYHSTDRAVFEALITWKRAQYRETRVPDVFAFPWTSRLLEQVLTVDSPLFAGKLSALYAGGRLIAVELGMRSGGVLHSWFPAYDQEYAAYSPGLLLLLEMAREAANRGVRRFDLGKGTGQYKSSFTSGTIPLAEGSVALGPLARLFRRGWHQTRAWAHSSRWGGPARLAGRLTRSFRGRLAFR